MIQTKRLTRSDHITVARFDCELLAIKPQSSESFSIDCTPPLDEITMFKHLLLPTDGSKLSNSAIERGIAFAKETGAKVTFAHVMPEYVVDAFVEFPSAAQASYNDFMTTSENTAKSILGAAQSLAKAAGVACDTVAVRHGQPWKAIIDVAGGRACDLIFMASHGRRGISALVLGSETHKVLTHSTVPVLVFR